MLGHGKNHELCEGFEIDQYAIELADIDIITVKKSKKRTVMVTKETDRQPTKAECIYEVMHPLVSTMSVSGTVTGTG